MLHECVSRYCLDEQYCEEMSVSERQRGEDGGGVLERESTKPHEGWRASKDMSKLYSFSIKGRTERGKRSRAVLHATA